MGRNLYLQDDTFLRAQARFFNNDGGGLLLFFLDDAILEVLERELALDISAFRCVADDTEWWFIDEEMPEETLRGRLLTLRQQMDATWQTPASLATAIERVLAAIASPQGFPSQLLSAIEALPIETTIDLEYYQDGELARDLRDLLGMVSHAVLRGATRVRLLVR